jgi:hypothetical protein
MSGKRVLGGTGSLILSLSLLLGCSAELAAQTTTGMIRGRVLNEVGAPVSAAEVVLTNTETGVQRSTLTLETGAYALVGVQPATYELQVRMIGYAAQPRSVRILIGQTLTIDLQMQPQAVQLQGITVVGTRVMETRTSEMATNVTEEQMRSLPQPDRNFLNFAGLAPGITVSHNEMNKQISAAGLPATKINVFIDGASFKNDILEGGVHGQDASRGNPFPQIALQEFRVITQNFKAEYQRAASAIVTATTRSGTNRFEMTGFVLGQNRGLVERNPGLQAQCDRDKANDPNFVCPPTPEYERLQLGLSAGGPIIRDRLHYFAAYENNIQDRQATVSPEGPQWVRPLFSSYAGTFTQPFRSHLGVAKLSYQPAQNQTLDLSWNGRFESDKRGFGGIRSFEAAEDVRISYNVLNLQHGMARGPWYNQAQVSAQRSTWNPTTVGQGGITREYMGAMVTGAKDTEQNFRQDRIALSNHLTRTGITWAGEHLIKGGINLDFLDYSVEKRLRGNPTFFYEVPQSAPPSGVLPTVPEFAIWGSGDPGMKESNVQFGAYIQDDWDVTPRLQLNLGVRWDAETNMFNNSWVTPDSVRAALGPILTATGRNPDDYFTRGREDRPMFLGALQPRLGFSYDLLGTGRTIVHGGFGVYYDREIWNRLIDERSRLTWVVRAFDFRHPTDTVRLNRIPWRPEYESAAGLQSLINQGGTGVGAGITSEIWLLKNDSRPPRSNQFNLGLRQTVAGMVLGAAYRGVRSENLTSWYCAKAHSEHGFCEGTQELGSRYKVLLSTDEGESRYNAFDVTAEKPFTAGSPWGFSVAYTFAEAQRRGGDFFSFDFLDNPSAWPWVNLPMEKHRIVASGIVGLPFEARLSTLMQWNSGPRYSRVDETAGWGPARARRSWFTETGDPIHQVDMRLQKDFRVPRGTVGLVAEAVNVFNTANYRGYEEFEFWGGGARNENFGQPQFWSADPGRRMQLGLDFRF